MDEQNPRIVVTKQIKQDLDKLKLVDTETYNSVISRLIKEASK